MNRNSQGRNRNPNSDGFVPRFAGDVFRHQGLNAESDAPTARRLTSEVAWKRPPSASIRSEIST
jgi:hypothetical protein